MIDLIMIHAQELETYLTTQDSRDQRKKEMLFQEMERSCVPSNTSVQLLTLYHTVTLPELFIIIPITIIITCMLFHACF